jgi:hypothetical protein
MSGGSGKLLAAAAGALLAAAGFAGAQPPAMPEGLADATAPALPEGLGEDRPDAGPALPAGLGDGDGPALPAGLEEPNRPATAPAERATWRDTLGLSGFWEIRGGVRTQRDPHQRQASLGETRLQLDLQRRLGSAIFRAVADVLYDPVLDRHDLDLHTGQGWLDLRQANVSFTPLEFLDVKVGRQILTWGTGDLLFINDLFPKDWQAFFVGRRVEYLKAPSDALKLSAFGDGANLDVVFTPQFDSDRFVLGRRLSYWSGTLGRRAGRDAVLDPIRPNRWFRDHETAVRLWRTVGGYELAAYGYWGYWKSPGGQDRLTQRPTFPRLSVYGGSVRGQLGGGIGNLEVGYYDSRQDRAGADPFVNNDELRLLAGYRRDLPEIARDLKLGLQYYTELMMDHDAYLRTLPAGLRPRDACRHVVTCRLAKLLMNQTLTLSLFAYYSPSDSDAYLRPKVSYKIDDHWTVEAGGNVFFGAHRHTFFGQLGRNTNVYAGLRYGF